MRHHIISLAERYVGGRWKQSGESNLIFSCPFHEDKSPSFSVNVDLGLFNCFSCKRSGNVIRLLKLLHVPDKTIDEETRDIRENIEANKAKLLWKKRSEIATRDPFLAAPILPESVLRPYLYAPPPQLGMEATRALPSRLLEAGFQPSWLDYLEVGFDRVNNRITYPIRDMYGHLAGVAGGAVIAGQEPKYKVYRGRYKDQRTGRMLPSDFGEAFDEKYPDYDFSNHDHLWNFDNVYPSLFFGRSEEAFLVIVEGYKACLWLLQAGYTNTVALMGSSMSEKQASLLHRLRVNLVLFLDSDRPGREATKKIGRSLWLQQQGVYIAQYPFEDGQPDDLSVEEVRMAIQGANTYPQWIAKGKRRP